MKNLFSKADKMKVFIDIETIPCQSNTIKDEIAAQFPDVAPFTEPSCPRTIKKPETRKEWEDNTLPGLREAALIKYQEDIKKRLECIDDTWRRTALHGDSGEIICIAWAIEDEVPHVVSRSLFYSEANLLTLFYQRIVEQLNQRNPFWIGHNVSFDLRFLFHRSVILKIKPPVHLYLDTKPWAEQVQDTMHLWAGLRDKISLDRLCKALDIPTKGHELPDDEHIDGSRVWDFVKRGEIDKVATYCKADVIRCREAYKRLTFTHKVACEASDFKV